MDLAPLSLHLILFQIFLGRHKTSTLSTQRCYSSNNFFDSLFFSLLALFRVRLPFALAGPADLDTCPNHFTCVSLRWLKDVIIGPNFLPDSVSDCIVSDVVSVWDAKQFLKASHLSGLQFLLDVHCQCSGIAGIQLYWENQGEHKSDLWA